MPRLLESAAGIIGESPSGKAAAFGAAIRRFESFLPSHPPPALHLALRSHYTRGLLSIRFWNRPEEATTLMRHAVTATLLALCLALPSLAADHPRKSLAGLKQGELTRIAVPAGAPRTAGDGVRRMNGPRAQVISFESSDFAFAFPIAGNVAGAFNTFYRTEITLINYLDVDQNIAVAWLPVGQDNTDGPFQYFTLPAGEFASYSDFVGTVLHQTGLGAILVIAYDGDGNIDEEAEIDGTSRIYTASSAGGTSSQTFPSVSLVDSFDAFTAVALGLRHGNGFRSNAGVLNLDTVAHRWTVFGGDGGDGGNNAEFTINVPALSVVQTAVPGDFPTANGFLVLGFEPEANGFAWSAYASSNDNVSGDGWVSRATQ